MRIKALFVFPFIVAGCLINSGGIAQTIQAHSRVEPIEGYSGQVSILPNASRRETTIVVNGISSTNSQQIVFHLQGASSSMPAAWSGQARVLAGGGVVAVVADDLPRGLLFIFPSLQIPQSMKQMSWDEYPVYGVARYGENLALTSGQIDQLVRNGSLSEPAVFDPNREKLFASPLAAKTCQSGGQGAAECAQSAPGGGGCNVVCNAGYYACCNSTGCTCVQEQ